MRRSPWILATVLAVGAAFAFAVPVQAGGGCHDPATEAASALVELRNACFGPTVTRVAVGDEVAFVNQDATLHNLVGFGAHWGEPEGMNQGETRRFTFSEAGIYPYACTLHIGMVGAVVVGGDEQRAGEGEAVVAGSIAPGDGGAASARRSSEGDRPLPVVVPVLVALVLGGGLVLRARRRSRRRAAPVTTA